MAGRTRAGTLATAGMSGTLETVTADGMSTAEGKSTAVGMAAEQRFNPSKVSKDVNSSRTDCST